MYVVRRVTIEIYDAVYEWFECPGLLAPSTSCLAATPAAEPTFMYMFSMRVEEKATADADSATGTSRFAPVPLFGTY